MRVTFVIAGLGAGGAERVLALLAADRVARGDHVSVIAFDSPDDRLFHSFDPAIEVLRLNLLSVPSRAFGLWWALRWTKPDLIVSFLFKINVITLAVSLFTGVPVIVSERNNPERQRAHAAWGWLRRLLYPRARAIVLQTEASRRTLPPAIASRGLIIPNPVTAWPAPDVSQDGARRLVAVGRLEDQKGFDLLIDAFAKADVEGWSLWIWGEGPLRALLEEQVRQLGLTGRVVLPGLSDRPGGWASQASAFVLSSRFEGYPNVLAEALASGLPVVATDCDFGPSEMIRHGQTGLLVPPNDVCALAAALRRLMTDCGLRTALARSARLHGRLPSRTDVLEQWNQVIRSSASSVD